MPEQSSGSRHTAVATKDCRHGQIVVEDGIVGSAFAQYTADRFTRPGDVPLIAIDEEFEIQVGGLQAARATGPLATADVGDRVRIDPADNELSLNGTAGLPVGVISEIDARPSPAIVRINLDAWQAFLPGT